MARTTINGIYKNLQITKAQALLNRNEIRESFIISDALTPSDIGTADGTYAMAYDADNSGSRVRRTVATFEALKRTDGYAGSTWINTSASAILTGTGEVFEGYTSNYILLGENLQYNLQLIDKNIQTILTSISTDYVPKSGGDITGVVNFNAGANDGLISIKLDTLANITPVIDLTNDATTQANRISIKTTDTNSRIEVTYGGTDYASMSGDTNGPKFHLTEGASTLDIESTQIDASGKLLTFPTDAGGTIATREWIPTPYESIGGSLDVTNHKTIFIKDTTTVPLVITGGKTGQSLIIVSGDPSVALFDVTFNISAGSPVTLQVDGTHGIHLMCTAGTTSSFWRVLGY